MGKKNGKTRKTKGTSGNHGGGRQGAGRPTLAVTQAAEAERLRLGIAGRKRLQRHREKCNELINQLGPFKKNRKKTEGCNAAAVTLFLDLFQHEPNNMDDCCDAVATHLHANKQYMRTMLKAVWANPEKGIPCDAPRRRKKPECGWVNGSKTL